MKLFDLPIYRTNVVRDSVQKVPRQYVLEPSHAAQILRHYFSLQGADREYYVILVLNLQNKMVGIKTVSIGTVGCTLAVPIDIFTDAKKCLGAAGMIIAHNHPSNETTPSDDDIKHFRRMIQLGKDLDFPILDCVIVGVGDAYYSHRERSFDIR